MKKLTFLLSMLMLSPAAVLHAEENKQHSEQPDNNYYWQGTQLYNLGRLGEAFDSFEKAIQRKQNSKEAEAYLLQIRQEIVTNAKKRAEERATLNYGANTPDSALNVQYVQKGYIRVTLQAKYLFDENTASLKVASMDVLNRLADLIQSKEGNRVELTLVDELDVTPNAKDIDAERSLLVFAYLNFKRIPGLTISPS
jgi:outer membrane protein assembly factor BamD (BamD/ComL family)